MDISNLKEKQQQSNAKLFHKQIMPLYLSPAGKITNFVLCTLITWFMDILGFANRADLKQFYCLFLICISLNTSKIEYILIGLLTILISSPEKYLFMPFAHFTG